MDASAVERPDPGPFDTVGHNTFVQDVVEHDGRWLAVGYAVDVVHPISGVEGLIWRSDDGRHWRRDDTARPDIQFDRVIAERGRLTIVGLHRAPDVGDQRGPTSLGMWTSADGGPWTEVSLPADVFGDAPSVQSLAVGGLGWLIQVSERDGGERWISGAPDGPWKRLDIDPTTFAGTQVARFAGTDDGWLAVGMTGWNPDPKAALVANQDDPSDDRGAIWRSTDGQHWTPVTVDRPGTSIGVILRVAGGFVAEGTDHGGCPRCVGHPTYVWRSDDGRAWSAVDLALDGDNRIGGLPLASDGLRGVAVDVDAAGRLRVRETADGRSWTPVQLTLDPALDPGAPQPFRTPYVGPDGLVTFDELSNMDGPEHARPVPYVGVPTASGAGATQAPMPTSHDIPCDPAGQVCG